LKKEWTVILSTCVIVLILLLIQIPIRLRNNTNVPQPSSSNVLSNSTANETSSQETSGIITMASKIDKYIVKEYNGRIGLFYNDETKPREVYDSDVSTLPEKDQEELKKGIVIKDRNSVHKIIEDYGS
jgi:hypothetical protein